MLALVFQHHWAEPILGFQSNGTIVSWLPLFLFVVLFGLSMDYHVFILSRVREAVDGGEPTETAVRRAIAVTAGVVTGAAVVMVCVFALFGTLSSLELKQAGVGLAAAVLIDATLIRAVLLPATMKLLGDWNWYLPRALQWLPGLARRAAPTPGSSSGPRSTRSRDTACCGPTRERRTEMPTLLALSMNHDRTIVSRIRVTFSRGPPTAGRGRYTPAWPERLASGRSWLAALIAVLALRRRRERRGRLAAGLGPARRRGPPRPRRPDLRASRTGDARTAPPRRLRPDAIHVRDLLMHTSGLYDYASDPKFVEYVTHGRHHWTRTEQVRFAITHGKPYAASGKEFHYSDTGYVLLGEIIERTTGRPLASAFRPCSASTSSVLPTYLESLEARPRAARLENNSSPCVRRRRPGPAGLIRSCLLRWVEPNVAQTKSWFSRRRSTSSECRFGPLPGLHSCSLARAAYLTIRKKGVRDSPPTRPEGSG